MFALRCGPQSCRRTELIHDRDRAFARLACFPDRIAEAFGTGDLSATSLEVVDQRFDVVAVDQIVSDDRPVIAADNDS